MTMSVSENFLRNPMIQPLSPGERVLIVGVRSTNLPDTVREDDRVICWDSTDPAMYRSEVPVDVGRIIITRFIDHSMFQRLSGVATRRSIPFERAPLTTGAVRRYLLILLGQEQPARYREVALTDIEGESSNGRPLTAKMGSFPIQQIQQADPTPPLPPTPPQETPTMSSKLTAVPYIRASFVPGRGESIIKQAQRLYAQRPSNLKAIQWNSFYQACQTFSRKSGVSMVGKPVKATAPASNGGNGNGAAVTVSATGAATANPAPVAASGELSQLITDAIVSMELIRERIIQHETTHADTVQALDKLRELLGR